MKTIPLKNIVIGEGTPKICVSICEQTQKQIWNKAITLQDTAVDIVEWRLDAYDDVQDHRKLLETLETLAITLKAKPLLLTFRSLQEGGLAQLHDHEYVALYTAIIESDLVSMIDIELSKGETIIQALIHVAHAHHVIVVMSNHEFHETPTRDEMIRRMMQMQSYDADIVKLAVMPQNEHDLLPLLEATLAMKELYADRPFLTMAMGKLGSISRVWGEVFGCCMSFASVGGASAPGQLDLQDMKAMLSLLHTYL